jgi:hypothetical protein
VEEQNWTFGGEKEKSFLGSLKVKEILVINLQKEWKKKF